MVDVQVGVQLTGEKDGVALLGRPDAENDTDCDVPDASVVVTEFVTEEPRVMDREPPFDIVKSNDETGAGVPRISSSRACVPPAPPLMVTRRYLACRPDTDCENH